MSEYEAVKATRVCGWLRATWRAAVAETIATALLISIGIASGLPHESAGQNVAPPLGNAALTVGFIVLANIETFGATCAAHMNPSVTLTAVLFGNMSPLTGFVYLVAQVLGAVLGFGILAIITPIAASPPTGCFAPAPGVTSHHAAIFEGILSAMLALLNCVLWANHEAGAVDNAAAVKISFVTSGLIFSGGYLSGGCFNPARALAPALYHAYFDYQWVYWVGPMGGAAVGTLLYRILLAPPPVHHVLHIKDVPLNDTKAEH